MYCFPSSEEEEDDADRNCVSPNSDDVEYEEMESPRRKSRRSVNGVNGDVHEGEELLSA